MPRASSPGLVTLPFRPLPEYSACSCAGPEGARPLPACPVCGRSCVGGAVPERPLRKRDVVAIRTRDAALPYATLSSRYVESTKPINGCRGRLDALLRSAMRRVLLLHQTEGAALMRKDLASLDVEVETAP